MTLSVAEKILRANSLFICCQKLKAVNEKVEM
jgi:hypothetical protein